MELKQHVKETVLMDILNNLNQEQISLIKSIYYTINCNGVLKIKDIKEGNLLNLLKLLNKLDKTH